VTSVIEDEDFVVVRTDDNRLKVVISDTGLPGADGTDGLSAYEIAVLEGFVGTELQWLDSLVGADGAPGAAGDPGPPGAPGGLIGSASAPLSINSASVILLEYDATTLSVGPDGLTVIGGTGSGDAETLDGFDSSYFINTSASAQTKIGDLNIQGTTKTGTLDLEQASVRTGATAIGSFAPVVIDSFDYTLYRTAEYIVQFSQGSSHLATKLLVLHGGGSVSISEFGTTWVGADIVYSFDAIVNGSNIDLVMACPSASTETVYAKCHRTQFDI
jgi:hypothetical protein